MVIFHSFLYVYQRVTIIFGTWLVSQPLPRRRFETPRALSSAQFFGPEISMEPMGLRNNTERLSLTECRETPHLGMVHEVHTTYLW